MVEPKVLQGFIKSAQEARDLYIPSSIAIVENISPLEFQREYVGRNIPVLIKNGCSHWPAIHKWTNQYLISTIKNKVTVAMSPDGRIDCIKNNKFVLPYETSTTLSDFFKKLNSSSMVSYIQKQNSSIDLEFDRLKTDFSEPNLGETFGIKPEATNIWIGNHKSVSSIHKDPFENLYAVVSGKKIFTLLPPHDTPFLYRKRYKVGVYDVDFNILDQDGTVPWIPVDPENPDYEKYPLFQYASPINVIVEQGDLLYLPALWYHKVRQDDDVDGRCIAVNFWYEMKYNSNYTWLVFQDHVLGIDE